MYRQTASIVTASIVTAFIVTAFIVAAQSRETYTYRAVGCFVYATL